MLWHDTDSPQRWNRLTWRLPDFRMKALPAIFKKHVHELRQQGKSARQIARETGLVLGTVKTWLVRGHEPRRESTSTKEKTAGHEPRHEPQVTMTWQQCLHFDRAHLFLAGGTKPVCADHPPGIVTTPGMVWMPHDSCVAKCVRCSKWANE